MRFVIIRLSNSAICILAALLLASSLALSAQNQTVKSQKVADSPSYLAGGKSIAISVPEKDLVEMGTDDQKAIDSLVPPSNRLIAAFVLPEDLIKTKSGDNRTPHLVSMIMVPRQDEFTEIGENDFKTIIDMVRKQFNSAVDSYVSDTEEEFNRRLKSLDLDNVKIKFDKPVSLGILFSGQNSAGFGTVLQASSGNASIRKVVSVVYLRVKNRVLFAYIYADYKDVNTVKWLRVTSEQWADAILKANQQ